MMLKKPWNRMVLFLRSWSLWRYLAQLLGRLGRLHPLLLHVAQAYLGMLLLSAAVGALVGLWWGVGTLGALLYLDTIRPTATQAGSSER